MSTSRRPAALFTITAALSVAIAAQEPAHTFNAAGLKRAIEGGLTATLRGHERLSSPAQAGVRVLDVRVDQPHGRLNALLST